MVAFGLLGWLFRKVEVPLVPIIMGVLLGKLMETNLRRELTISDGNWWALFDSPLAIGIWVCSILGFVAPLLIGRYIRPARIAVKDLETMNAD